MDYSDKILDLYSTVFRIHKSETNVNNKSLQKAAMKMKRIYVPNLNWETRCSYSAVNYNSAAHRCAYIYKYATFHTDVLCEILQTVFLILRRQEFLPLRKHMICKEPFNLCCLGGGPGTDVVSLLFVLREVFGVIPCDVSVIDIKEEWKQVFKLIISELKTGRYGKVSDIVSNRYFSSRYITSDLLSLSSNSRGLKEIQKADFITMMKFVSAAACDKTPGMLKDIFRNMKPNAVVLFVDNVIGGYYEMFRVTAAECGMENIKSYHRAFKYEKMFTTKRREFRGLYRTTVSIELWRKNRRDQIYACDRRDFLHGHNSGLTDRHDQNHSMIDRHDQNHSMIDIHEQNHSLIDIYEQNHSLIHIHDQNHSLMDIHDQNHSLMDIHDQNHSLIDKHKIFPSLEGNQNHMYGCDQNHGLSERSEYDRNIPYKHDQNHGMSFECIQNDSLPIGYDQNHSLTNRCDQNHDVPYGRDQNYGLPDRHDKYHVMYVCNQNHGMPGKRDQILASPGGPVFSRDQNHIIPYDENLSVSDRHDQIFSHHQNHALSHELDQNHGLLVWRNQGNSMPDKRDQVRTVPDSSVFWLDQSRSLLDRRDKNHGMLYESFQNYGQRVGLDENHCILDKRDLNHGMLDERDQNHGVPDERDLNHGLLHDSLYSGLLIKNVHDGNHSHFYENKSNRSSYNYKKDTYDLSYKSKVYSVNSKNGFTCRLAEHLRKLLIFKSLINGQKSRKPKRKKRSQEANRRRNIKKRDKRLKRDVAKELKFSF